METLKKIGKFLWLSLRLIVFWVIIDKFLFYIVKFLCLFRVSVLAMFIKLLDNDAMGIFTNLWVSFRDIGFDVLYVLLPFVVGYAVGYFGLFYLLRVPPKWKISIYLAYFELFYWTTNGLYAIWFDNGKPSIGYFDTTYFTTEWVITCIVITLLFATIWFSMGHAIYNFKWENSYYSWGKDISSSTTNDGGLSLYKQAFEEVKANTSSLDSDSENS